jgi:hypothetical protein
MRSVVGEVKKSNHRIASSPGKMMMGNGRKCLLCSEVDYCFHLGIKVRITNYKLRKKRQPSVL